MFMGDFSLGRVDAFLKSILHDDRVAIVHDVDPDGIFSAVILARFVKKFRGRKPEFVAPFDKCTYSITDADIGRMQRLGITKLLVTDFSLDQHPGLVKRLAGSFRILILDHHTLYDDVNSGRVVLVKPQMFCDIDPARYCAAKLAFDLCSRVVDMSDCDWLAASASIADVAHEPWQGWIRSVMKKYGDSWRKDLFSTKLGTVATVVNSVVVANPSLISRCFDVAYRAASPDDVIDSDLYEWKERIDDELGVWLDRFRKCERHGDLYMFFIEPDYNIKSALSTILGLKYPHRTILVMDEKDGFINVSARRGDKKVAVNSLLEKAIKGFPLSNAGGHVPAAGARLRVEDLPEFKKRVIELG